MDDINEYRINGIRRLICAIYVLCFSTCEDSPSRSLPLLDSSFNALEIHTVPPLDQKDQLLDPLVRRNSRLDLSSFSTTPVAVVQSAELIFKEQGASRRRYWLTRDQPSFSLLLEVVCMEVIDSSKQNRLLIHCRFLLIK